MQPGTRRPVRVLMVEDCADMLFLMKTELEWLGYAMEVADNGVDGLRLARASQPDVVVSDIQMPGIDGFEFVRQVRQIPELEAIPAIALTGWDLGRRGKVLDYGFDAQRSKPVDAAELSALIDLFAYRTRLSRAS